MDGRIFQLQEQLLEKLEYQWTIQEMADLIELSVPHLQKLFKNEAGVAPFAWIQERRLEKACELLKTTSKRINQIGLIVGMPNDSHFTRDFKKKYGVTPTEYRKNHWDKIQAEKQIGRK